MKRPTLRALSRPLLPLAAALLTLAACGARSRRDPETPAREITYDDLCQLQPYFDERRASSLGPPRAADETIAVDEKGQTIGGGSYVLVDPMARRRFGRMLRDEYKGVAEPIVAAAESGQTEVRVRVRWWDSGATRRLRPDNDIVVVTAAGEVELPPNPCVADLLFGAKIYEMRARYVRGESERAHGDEPTASATSETSAPLASATSSASSAPTSTATDATSPSASSASPPAATSSASASPPPR